MRSFDSQKSAKVAIEGDFYCPFDPVTRQIRLAIKATSMAQAQHRMAILAHLIGFKQAGELAHVVLEEAPQGVPPYGSSVVPMALT